jgi:curved DNA-binding protein
MPLEFKDYYKVLGVPRDATEDQVRKAFRKLAREFHPDVAKDKARAEEKFKEINEAYEVLGDPEKRKKYDTLGANWNRPEGGGPPPGFNRGRGPGRRNGSADEREFHFGGTGFSDFFEQFFGGRGFEFVDENEAGQRARDFAQRGQDVEGAIMVTLQEALHGSVRSVSLQKANPQTGETATQTFRVKIPAGIQEGKVIRIAGKGQEGMGGGPAGDLYLRVRFARHPDFRVSGADLHCELELAPWEAVLGTTVSVPTLEGSISLRVPPGSTRGQKLRVRGKGLPSGENARGDLYASIELQIPGEISDAEKEAWETLARVSKFNPRKSV